MSDKSNPINKLNKVSHDKSNKSNPVKSVKSNLTLSIDNHLLEEIKKDTERQGISVNSKVNSILAKYVSFYRITEEMECSIIPSKLWILMLDLMDEEKLLNILNTEGISALYSIFLNNNIPLTLENFIKHCCQEIFLWSGMYSSFRRFDGSKEFTLIFEHKYGIKWSRILSTNFTNFLRIVLDRKAESQILPNTVRITITKK